MKFNSTVTQAEELV